LLYVQASQDLASYRACATWLKAIQDVAADLRSGPSREDWKGVVVRYTGRPVFVREIAESMQKDMSGSVVGTAVIIALLFWLTHRRWLPMLWLLTLLGLILAATLALGGLVLGTISVVEHGVWPPFCWGWRWIMPWYTTRRPWPTQGSRCRRYAAPLRRAFFGRPSPQ